MRIGEIYEQLRDEGFDVESVRRKEKGGAVEVAMGPTESADRWEAAQTRAAELDQRPAAPTFLEAVGVLLLRTTVLSDLDEIGRKARAVVAKHVQAARERRIAGED